MLDVHLLTKVDQLLDQHGVVDGGGGVGVDGGVGIVSIDGVVGISGNINNKLDLGFVPSVRHLGIPNGGGFDGLDDFGDNVAPHRQEHYGSRAELVVDDKLAVVEGGEFDNGPVERSFLHACPWLQLAVFGHPVDDFQNGGLLDVGVLLEGKHVLRVFVLAGMHAIVGDNDAVDFILAR